MFELDELLKEVSSESPCGPDLTYDADFLALESAARGKTEQQFGDTVIPAEPPEWREVEARACALLIRSKDLRVAVALCRAWVSMKGLTGFAAGLGLVCGLLERYWETVHPVAEDGDYFMRMNAVSSLNEVSGLLRDLRQVEFFRSPAGMVSVRDAEALARGNAVEGGHQMSLDQLRIAVQEAYRQGSPIFVAILAANDSLASIVELCVAKLPGAQRPETDGLQSILGSLRELMPSLNSASADDSQASAVSNEISAQSPASPAGVLRSRDDAIAQLLSVAAFVEKTEPTNPAPLLIRRAARLMRMGFIEILRELSPDSLSQIENITGGTSL
jgi:type VI secretion system protein ImpA